jgi:hypothetical protein
MQMRLSLPLVVLALSLSACGKSSPGDAATSATAKTSAGAKTANAAKTAKPTAATSVSASSSVAATAPAGDTSVLGAAAWKAAFAGAAPVELPYSLAGGQGGGMSDDYTMHIPNPNQAKPPWKFGATLAGGNYTSPSGKVVVVGNSNIKMDPTNQTVETWAKAALIKELKLTDGPAVIELGPTKALVLAGRGTCTMKDGDPADVYWWDAYSAGDFSHKLHIVIVSKNASEDEKKVALTMLRGLTYTDKAKPHYKK